jgi:N-acyl-D-aspartate/D-glutamate deacylase
MILIPWYDLPRKNRVSGFMGSVDRRATVDDLTRMKDLTDKAMREGAWECPRD